MPIISQGAVRPNYPGAFVVEILPTSPASPIQTNLIGNVGGASWGVVNAPVYSGSLNEAISQFGFPQTGAFDLMTTVYAEQSVGANNFVNVRVTDGTDLAADIDVVDTTIAPVIGMKLTAKYTGSAGNTLLATVAQGSNSTVGTPTFKITIQFPAGSISNAFEVFDNIGGTGLALWQNIVNAINMGQGALTPASQLVVATIGTATNPPVLANYTLTGGTDGTSGLNEAAVIGLDTGSRSGLYALRGTSLNMLVLAGVTTAANYAAMVDFASYEQCYAIISRPISEGYAAAITARKSVALSSVFAKLMVGDWIKIQDGYNQVQRYIPQNYIMAAVLATLPPQLPSLNKKVTSSIMLATQSSENNFIYSGADIANMLNGSVDVIAYPSASLPYFAAQTGVNTLSANELARWDSYTRLSAEIAEVIQQIIAPQVGQLQTEDQRRNLIAQIVNYLQGLVRQEIIGTVDPNSEPYSVVLNNTNNPTSSVAAGIENIDIKVCFFTPIVQLFANLQTGLVSINENATNGG